MLTAERRLRRFSSRAVNETSAGTGTVMRRSTFEGYTNAAGFDAVSVLPIDHEFLRFYRLDR
jgi:hypothetical protein